MTFSSTIDSLHFLSDMVYLQEACILTERLNGGSSTKRVPHYSCSGYVKTTFELSEINDSAPFEHVLNISSIIKKAQ